MSKKFLSNLKECLKIGLIVTSNCNLSYNCNSEIKRVKPIRPDISSNEV